MGNNKKTVKCSFCGRLGHNRVSCVKLKNIIESERKEYGSSHPDVRLYDSLKKRYSDKSSRNASATRHCSYCTNPNHNIRSCTVRQKDIQYFKKVNFYWRMGILESLEERGIGVGAIMSSRYSKRYGSRLYSKGDKWILTSIAWDNLKFDYGTNKEDHEIFKLVNLTNSAVVTTLSVNQLLATTPTISGDTDNYWDVVSPSTTLDFPDGWDTITDKEYDKHLIYLFGHSQKKDIDSLLKFSYSYVSTDMLEKIDIYMENLDSRMGNKNER